MCKSMMYFLLVNDSFLVLYIYIYSDVVLGCFSFEGGYGTRCSESTDTVVFCRYTSLSPKNQFDGILLDSVYAIIP